MQHDDYKVHFLLHAAALIEETLRHRLANLGVRPRQARILDALDRIGEASQVELAREFDLTPASMSTMIARLLAAGYVARRIDPEEARSNIVQLSDKGRSLLDEVRVAWSDVDRVIEAKIGREEAEQLAHLTRALRDELGGRAPGEKT